MALKKTSITISEAMVKDGERNGFQANRSARISDVFERYHAILDAAEYPEVLNDAEYELMAELIEQGLEHHPALPLHRAVARLLEDRELDGEDLPVDPDTMCQKLARFTRDQEMALIEAVENNVLKRRQTRSLPD